MASDPNSSGGQAGTGSSGPVALSGLTLASAQDQGLVAAPVESDMPPSTGKGTPIAVVAEKPLDRTRQRLAYVLLGTLLVIVALVMGLSTLFAAGCWRGGDCTKIQPAMQVMNTAVQPLFTAMIGLVGSVVGFYFGSKTTD